MRNRRIVVIEKKIKVLKDKKPKLQKCFIILAIQG